MTLHCVVGKRVRARCHSRARRLARTEESLDFAVWPSLNLDASSSDLLRVHPRVAPQERSTQNVTNNLDRRVTEHEERRPGSFMARYNMNRLVYFEEFDVIKQAIARESEIKRMERQTKITLIESVNSAWRDLLSE
jgi:putative endonuclease